MFNKYKNEVRQLREENDGLRKALDRLEDALEEAPEGCKRGAWCAACAWNIKAAGPYYMIGACTLGACNNFVKMENPRK